MKNIILAENLKMKRTMGKRMIIFAPVITMLLSFVAGSFFYQCAFNWWYTLFWASIQAIVCAQVDAKEKKGLGYKNVYVLPYKPGKIWRGKLLLLAVYLFVANLILSVLSLVFAFVFKVNVETGIASVFLAAVVIFFTNSYQIPIYFYAAHKWNAVFAFLLSVLMSVAGVAFATKSYWWAIPFTWCTRLMVRVLHILPNGLIAEAGEKIMPSSACIFPILAISVILFAVSMYVTEKLLEQKGKME